MLTGFGVNELQELYDAETLAFDIWRCGAALRMSAKGASVRVVGGDIGFSDHRTEELNRLVESLDKRALGAFRASSSGVLFVAGGEGITGGLVLCPDYNVGGRSISAFTKGLDKAIGYPFTKDEATRFAWNPLNIGGYIRSHAPFSDAFTEKHGVRLEAVVGTIGALLASAYMSWRDRTSGVGALFAHWRRAYVGPLPRAQVIRALQEALPQTLRWVAPDVQVDSSEVPAAVTFLELSKAV